MFQQLLLNGLVAGSVYALVALGFSLVYGTTRFFHFAHGAVYTVGAYSLYTIVAVLGMPLAIGIPVAVVAAVVVGAISEIAVYRPLRRRQASALILLIASLGIYIVIQNTISLVYGDDIKTVRSEFVREGWLVLGARITQVQVLIVVSAIVLFFSTSLLISRTKIGRAMRAVANDSELASACGIDADKVILFAFGLGSALAGIAAMLVSFDVDILPTMGMNALLMGVVATIVGGVGSIPGAAWGGIILGLAQNIGIWKIGSEWQDAIGFAVLLVFLLVRPQGIYGKRPRKTGV